MDPRYPIGKFDPQQPVALDDAVEQIAALPAQIREVAGAMTEAQLGARYREGGWTARQVIHHLADSHINAYVRFRLALTEDLPVIKPYKEALWAELPDAAHGPVEDSLRILDGVHARWAALLRATPREALERKFRHPERGELTLASTLALYAWHGRHHLAHLRICAQGGA